MKMCEDCKGNCRVFDKPFIERKMTANQIISETEDFELKMIIPICAIICVVLGIISMFIGE